MPLATLIETVVEKYERNWQLRYEAARNDNVFNEQVRGRLSQSDLRMRSQEAVVHVLRMAHPADALEMRKNFYDVWRYEKLASPLPDPPPSPSTMSRSNSDSRTVVPDVCLFVFLSQTTRFL